MQFIGGELNGMQPFEDRQQVNSCGTPRAHCAHLNTAHHLFFSSTHHHHRFQISLFRCNFSLLLSEVDKILNGSRLTFWCAAKCINVVPHVSWFALHLTDTNSTGYTPSIFLQHRSCIQRWSVRE